MSVVFEMQVHHVHKLVLLALADRANDAGTECYPAVSTLVRKTSLSERTVRKTISDLVKLGYMEVFERHGHSNNYVLHLPTVPLHALHPPRRSRLTTPARRAPLGALESVDKPVDNPKIPLHAVHPTPAPDAPHPCTPCTPTPARRAPNPSCDPSGDPSLIHESPPTPQRGAAVDKTPERTGGRQLTDGSAAAWARACECIDAVRGDRTKTWAHATEALADPIAEAAIKCAGGHKLIADRDRFTQGQLKKVFRKRFEELSASSNSTALRGLALGATKAMP